MTEQKIENNWIDNITHPILGFMVSWLFVGYVRIHILKIPYTIYHGFSYDFIASFICVALLFLLYKKVPLKVSLEWLITGILFCFFVFAFTTRIAVLAVMDSVHTLYHPYVETAKFLAYLFFVVPIITYLLAFVNKKIFTTISWIYIILSILTIIVW